MKKIKAEATESSTTEKSSKRKAATKASDGKTKARSADGQSTEFDFVGKVESVTVKGSSELDLFEFGLRGRHGARQTFRLRTSDAFALSVMAPVVTAAHATDAKIGVRVSPADAGQIYVVEVASRPKLGKSA